MLIDDKFLLMALCALQFMTALSVVFVGYAVVCLRCGIAHLKPVVLPPRPPGNPTINIYDTVAYFVEWCQAQDHTGDIEFPRAWQLYQKFCAMRGIPEANQVARTMLASRLTHLLGFPKTLSDSSGRKRRRLQIYTIPCPLDWSLDGSTIEVPSRDVVNFQQQMV